MRLLRDPRWPFLAFLKGRRTNSGGKHAVSRLGKNLDIASFAWARQRPHRGTLAKYFDGGYPAT